MKYIAMHWLEVFGIITAIIYLYFSINRKAWLWILGAFSSAIYVVVFFKSHLYADMLKDIFYVIISIYGYMKWVYQDKTFDKEHFQAKVNKLNKKTTFNLIILGIILFVLIYIPVKFLPHLLNISSASIPVVDSFLTALCFLATWMLTKCYIEQWIIWIIIDGAYIFVYIYKGLFITSLLFFIYTVMAVVGYLKWRKNI